MIILRRLTLAWAALLIAAPTAAQYRDSDAAVLVAPPLPVPPGMVAANDFRAAYARAGRPRLMVFWNRAFSDEVASTYRDTLHAEGRDDSHSMAHDDMNQSRLGTSRLQEASSGNHTSLDVSAGTDRVDARRSAVVDENLDFAMEAAFTETLAANGAVLVDRSLAMRTAGGARGAGPRANVQQIETDAATGRADLMVEVLATAAPIPTGVVFKISVKNIRAARVLAVFTSAGSAPQPHAGLVAGPGGFVRAAAAGTPSPGAVGHELANRLMVELARSLR